jgi:hypothetical protein
MQLREPGGPAGEFVGQASRIVHRQSPQPALVPAVAAVESNHGDPWSATRPWKWEPTVSTPQVDAATPTHPPSAVSGAIRARAGNRPRWTATGAVAHAGGDVSCAAIARGIDALAAGGTPKTPAAAIAALNSNRRELMPLRRSG